MKEVLKSEGLIIRLIDYKENAVIATVLTKEGKESIIIRGAKKMVTTTHRLASLLTLISYTKTSTTPLATLIEGVVINNYTTIKSDLIKYNTVLVMLEKLNFFLDEINTNKFLYPFVISLLEAYQKSSFNTAYLTIFEIKLLYLLGVSPILNKCIVCGDNLKVGNLSIKSGGLICPRCALKTKYDLSSNDSLIYKEAYYTKLKDVDEKLLAVLEQNNNISNFIDEYYNYYLDFSSKTKKILKKIG